MRKITAAIILAAFAIFTVDWVIVGVMLLNGNYNILAGAVIGLGCLALIVACSLIRAFTDKCPHCGRLRVSNGAWCPFCGGKI